MEANKAATIQRHCDTCDQMVSEPCSSADCSTPDLPWPEAVATRTETSLVASLKEAGKKIIASEMERTAEVIRLRDVNADLVMALQDTLNMLRAAHMQLGIRSDDNKRVINAKAVLTKAQGA